MQCPSARATQPCGVKKACPPYSVMPAEAAVAFCLTNRVSAQASGGPGFPWLPWEHKDGTAGGPGNFAHGAVGTLAAHWEQQGWVSSTQGMGRVSRDMAVGLLRLQ